LGDKPRSYGGSGPGGDTAVELETLPGNVAGGGKKNDEAGHFEGIVETLEHVGFRDGGERCGREMSGHGRVKEPGKDEIAADVMRSGFACEGESESCEGGFGCGISGLAARTAASCEAADIQDVPGVALDHMGQNGLSAAAGAVEIDVEHTVPIGLGGMPERLIDVETRIVNEGIDMAPTFEDSWDGVTEVRWIGDVQRNGPQRGAGLALNQFSSMPPCGDPPILTQEFGGERAAQAASGAGDEDRWNLVRSRVHPAGGAGGRTQRPAIMEAATTSG
jgi:hypothetical protein